MRRLWPFLFILLLCLPAAWPYFGGNIPRTNDTLFHYYRAVELARLVRAGVLFPRWAPDLAHGYGYPIFNYFAYFSHYLIVLLNLAGLPMLWALRAAYILSLLASGVTAFALGRELFGEQAGVVAAVAYVYSPYVLYTAHVRGGLPESLAMALLPLALWGVWRALRAWAARAPVAAMARPALVAALAIAGFIAAHIGMALQYLPVIGVFALYALLRGGRQTARHWALGVMLVGGMVGLGLGLTAFMWLPTLLELNAVQFAAAFARAGSGYAENFFRLADLFAYPRVPLYADALNPPLVRSLPLAAVGLAGVGLLAGILSGVARSFDYRRNTAAVRSGSLRRAIEGYLADRLISFDFLFVLAMALGASFLIVNTSKPVWDALPLLQRSAFPWRFLGPATLFVALAAGGAVSFQLSAFSFPWSANTDRAARGTSPIVHCFIVSLFIVTALPFLFPPREPAPEAPTLADLARFEIPPLLVGTTTTGEYTPVWVAQFPDTHEQQVELLAGREPQRLQLPPSASARVLAARPADDRYAVTAAEPFTALYRSFYFPGWQVILDGKPAPIKVTYPDGLISFDVPAGEHTVELRFGSTPARSAAGAASVVSLWVAVGGWWAARRRSVGGVSHDEAVNGPSTVPLTAPQAAFTLALTVAALLVGAKLIVRHGPPPMQHPLELDFGGELTLHGYSRQGDAVTLAWQAQHPIGVPYGMNVRLTDDAGLVWSDTNIARPADWRFFPGTDFWPTDEFIYDSYLIRPVRGAPPGAYHLEAIVYRADTLQALSVQRIGDYVIERPTREPLAAPLANFDGATLVGALPDRATASPGEPYRLTLLWQAASDSPPDRGVRLELVDAAERVRHAITSGISPQYPPGQWKKGDVIAQSFFFRLPARVPEGKLHWQVNGVPVAELSVNGLSRSFVPPKLALRFDVAVGQSIKLVGANVRASDRRITIELAWQATSEMADSYRVFVHVLDASGALVAQSDGEPVNWTRPTSGWLAGEVVLDERALSVPGPGEYTLWAGMVTESGDRLPAEGRPDGAIKLGVVTLAP